MNECWKMHEEALDRTLWRRRFGRGYGLFERQTMEWMHTLYKMQTGGLRVENPC
jgi:hypothetical protein